MPGGNFKANGKNANLSNGTRRNGEKGLGGVIYAKGVGMVGRYGLVGKIVGIMAILAIFTGLSVAEGITFWEKKDLCGHDLTIGIDGINFGKTYNMRAKDTDSLTSISLVQWWLLNADFGLVGEYRNMNLAGGISADIPPVNKALQKGAKNLLKLITANAFDLEDSMVLVNSGVGIHKSESTKWDWGPNVVFEVKIPF